MVGGSRLMKSKVQKCSYEGRIYNNNLAINDSNRQ